MARVFLLHWHRAEVEDRAAPLRAAGHTVSLHWNTEASPALKDSLPDIAVISLDRLPSHGRAVAEWLWEAKKRQYIPIIFAGGEPTKIAATRAKFPAAVFCSTASLPATVAKVAETGLSENGPKGRAPSRRKGSTDAKRPHNQLQRPARTRRR